MTIFQHVLSVLELDEEAQDTLRNLRTITISDLLNLTINELNDNFPIGYVNNITTFQFWYENYLNNHNGRIPDIMTEFTEEALRKPPMKSRNWNSTTNQPTPLRHHIQR